jgi:hypothetical protein
MPQIALLIQLRQFAQALLHLLPSSDALARGLLRSLGNVVTGGLPLLPAVTHIQMWTMLRSIPLAMAARSSASAVSFRECSKDSDFGQTLNLEQQSAPLRSSINPPSHDASDVLDSDPLRSFLDVSDTQKAVFAPSLPIRVLVSEPDVVSRKFICALLERESSVIATFVDDSTLVSSIQEALQTS